MTYASVNGKFDVEVFRMCVVPIKILLQKLYDAMLDNCSQGSFIKQDLLRRLHFKILTEKKSEETLLVDSLKIAGVTNNWISLP